MPQLHIANTFFEHELASAETPTLRTSILSHPLYLQLQYLPFLYGNPEDGVLVTHAPSPGFLQHLELMGIKGPQHWHICGKKIPDFYSSIESWGLSRSVATWSKQHRQFYPMPEWDLVERVNSKAFSFAHGFPLPHAQLLQTQEQLSHWMYSFVGSKVLKTCYGLSGRGHFHLSTHSENECAKAISFARAEWEQGRPILAEPWVKRVIDFSTQWYITRDSNVDYLGATLCENDNFGRYLATRIGNETELFGDFLPFLEQHKTHVRKILLDIAQNGFFGHIGIDAMVYHYPDKISPLYLQPIVEINARKTMGWVALEIRKRYFPKYTLRMTLRKADPSSPSLLPHSVAQSNAAPLRFPKQLVIEPVITS